VHPRVVAWLPELWTKPRDRFNLTLLWTVKLRDILPKWGQAFKKNTHPLPISLISSTPPMAKTFWAGLEL